MIGGTVTHLRPRVASVAVRAEQPQVAPVSLPIAQAVVPGSRASLLQAAVDMVNVEDAEVGLATSGARSTKLRNEGQLPPPVARMLVQLVRVDRPVGVATGDIAKAMLAGFSALLTSRAPLPSGGEVAVAPAILPGAISQAVKMGFKRLGAMRATNLNSALFHCRNIHARRVQNKCDIACKRIEDAQRQGDMFIGAAA